MSEKGEKKYAVWAVIDDMPESLLADGNNSMSYEIAIEKAIKFIAASNDTSDWSIVMPHKYEEMKWQNSKGDRVIISEVFQSKN